MEHHGYDKLVKHHRDKRQANRHGKYHQTEIDKAHESKGMKKYHKEKSHR